MRLCIRRVVAVLAMACGLAGPARAETTVTFMGWVNMFDFQKPGWARIMENFARAHPDIRINYVGTPAEDTLRQITAAILANRPPDIMQMSAPWVVQLNEQDALEPLGPLLGHDEMGRLWNTGVQALTIDGKTLAVPWLPAPFALSYNRNLFKRAGLDPDRPPATWQEMMDAVDKICALPAEGGGPKPYGIVLRSSRDVIAMGQIAYYVFGFGGEVTDAKGRPAFDNPGAVKAFEWIRDTIRRGCSPDAADTQVARQLFAQGRAGFELDGPYIRGLVKTMSDGKMQYGAQADAWIVPPLKGLEGRTRLIGASNILAISSQSKNKAAAATFIRFLLDDADSVNHFYQTSQQITTGNLEVIRGGPMGQDPYLAQFINGWDAVNIVPVRSARIDAILDGVGLSLQKIIKGADATAELKALTAQIRELDR